MFIILGQFMGQGNSFGSRVRRGSSWSLHVALSVRLPSTGHHPIIVVGKVGVGFWNRRVTGPIWPIYLTWTSTNRLFPGVCDDGETGAVPWATSIENNVVIFT